MRTADSVRRVSKQQCLIASARQPHSEHNIMSKIITEREIYTKLIKKYKHSPCLWDPSHFLYSNKEARHNSLHNMLHIWQKIEPDGTEKSLKKKLEHFRAAYRRARKKVESRVASSGGEDCNYKPNLWYYNLMTFLNEKPDSNCSSDEDDDEYLSPPPTKKNKVFDPIDIFNNDKQEQLDTEEYKTKWKSPNYLNAYGEAIANQLKELDEPIRFEAERIISDVIYRARTGNLPKYTPDVVDSLVIPQSGPSWYETPVVNNSENYFAVETIKMTNTEDIKTEACYEEEC